MFSKADQIQTVLLVWRKNLYLIIGIARGMLYLHQGLRFWISIGMGNDLSYGGMGWKTSGLGVARF